jgi:hypothetical protein
MQWALSQICRQLPSGHVCPSSWLGPMLYLPICACCHTMLCCGLGAVSQSLHLPQKQLLLGMTQQPVLVAQPGSP